MTIEIDIPTQGENPLPIQLKVGEQLFVLGANGTGKSALMSFFFRMNVGGSLKISAHRQTWMQTDTVNLTPASKPETEQAIQRDNQKMSSRYKDDHAEMRTNMTIYELIDAENVLARKTRTLLKAGDSEAITNVLEEEEPIAVINELLKESNIPITISIREHGRIMASKNGGQEYSAAALSDGERNALLIAGDVLTAKAGTLLIIDEPERHLHRSIISPLLGQLFQRRSDCAFVVSTHDHNLPLELPSARTLLLRSCTVLDEGKESWEIDELPFSDSIDDTLRRDLLGARRKILFVEGTENSLDKLLYKLIFPMVSIIPKGSSNDVERAVAGLWAGKNLHWLHAFGIVDGDGYEASQIEAKKTNGVYALPVYSVEAIYFLPDIIQLIADRQASTLGEDPTTLADNAIMAGVAAIKANTTRLITKAAKKSIRKKIVEKIQNDDILLDGDPVNIRNDATSILQDRKEKLDTAVEEHDWQTILTKCPVRESPALNNIVKKLQFPDIQNYYKAVRQLLATDDDALKVVRELFDDLYEKLKD